MYDLGLLKLDVLELINIEQTHFSVSESQRISQQIIEKIHSSDSLVNSIPECVWHFLSDADVRWKDNKYATESYKFILDEFKILG